MALISHLVFSSLTKQKGGREGLHRTVNFTQLVAKKGKRGRTDLIISLSTRFQIGRPSREEYENKTRAASAPFDPVLLQLVLTWPADAISH